MQSGTEFNRMKSARMDFITNHREGRNKGGQKWEMVIEVTAYPRHPQTFISYQQAFPNEKHFLFLKKANYE